jgi:hypothetical protein
VIADLPHLAAGTGPESTYPAGAIGQITAAVHRAGPPGGGALDTAGRGPARHSGC